MAVLPKLELTNSRFAPSHLVKPFILDFFANTGENKNISHFQGGLLSDGSYAHPPLCSNLPPQRASHQT